MTTNDMSHEEIERLANEAYAVFCRRWAQVESQAGKATQIEIWHHAFRAGMEVKHDNQMEP